MTRVALIIDTNITVCFFTSKAESRATPLTTKYKYGDALSKSLLFYYAQRSGKLPADDNPVPWRKDSALKDKGENGEDLTGGYYDGKIQLLRSLFIFTPDRHN